MNTSASTIVKIKRFWANQDKGVAEFSNGLEIHFPLRWFPRLEKASAEQLSQWELIGTGSGLHWPGLDEDISAEGILLGRKSVEYKPFQSPLTAAALKDLRCELLHMTQRELGQALGYSETTIRHLEKGRSPITQRFEELLSNLL